MPTEDDPKKQLEQAQMKLTASLDQLDTAWRDVNEFVRSLDLPIEAWVEVASYDEGDWIREEYLVWKKCAGEWQVCYATGYDQFPEDFHAVPVLSLDGKVKLRCTKWVGKLYSGLIDECERFFAGATKRSNKLADRIRKMAEGIVPPDEAEIEDEDE